MLLVIDIGNTSIHAGVFKKQRIIRTMLIQSDPPAPIGKRRAGTRKQDILKALKKCLSADIKNIKGVIVSSVVPGVTIVTKHAIKKLLNIKPVILGSDLKVPIKNLYKEPKQVGQDRLVNAYACKELYGSPAIVLDFGTATTFDYINRFGEYEGGIITPGVSITIDALAEKTALLPRIKLDKPDRLIGKDTVDSIRSGLFFGLASMCDGLVLKIKKSYKAAPIVIATGGLVNLFSPYCKEINKIDKYLTLKGLSILYKTIDHHPGK
jgi:type III pantothenate kinase